MKKEVDHEYTENIICPYCGEEISSGWELSPDKEDIGLIECGSCEKHFYATRNISISYTTVKATYGTCKHCQTPDVPVEDLNSSVGHYEGLCVECGVKEKNRLEREYFERLNISL